MLFLLILLWLAIFLVYYRLKHEDFLKKAGTIPSPRCYPLIGHASMFIIGQPENIFAIISSLKEKFDRLVAIWMGPWFNVLLFDPKDVEVVLKESKNMRKAYQYEFLRPWLGDSILLSNGAKFRQNKKILMQSFHVNNLKEYVEIFNQQARKLVGNLENEVGKGEFDIYSYLSPCTMNTLLETSLGVDQETITEKDALNYSKAVEKVGRLINTRAYKLWLYPNIIFRFSKLKKEQDKYIEILNTLTKRVISKRKREYEQRKVGKINVSAGKSNKFLDNFFDAIKDNGETFLEEEIKDEVMTMMFAGQDTTTVSLGFALSLLGIFQQVQKKVVAELEDIFRDSKREPTYEDLLKMKYLEQVIQETWRLFPPIPLIAKTSTQDIVLDGCTIPKDSTIAIILMILHRDPKQFPNPNRFNPDHFLPERIKQRHPCSFIPFSANYRACIGPKYVMLVIKVVLSSILRNYRVFSDRKMRDFVLAAQTTLKRKEGYLIRLEKRYD